MSHAPYKVKVEDLELESCIDLQNDPFADPNGDDPGYAEFHAFVDGVSLVTESDGKEVVEVIILQGGDVTIAFPKGHEVMVCPDAV